MRVMLTPFALLHMKGKEKKKGNEKCNNIHLFLLQWLKCIPPYDLSAQFCIKSVFVTYLDLALG